MPQGMVIHKIILNFKYLSAGLFDRQKTVYYIYIQLYTHARAHTHGATFIWVVQFASHTWSLFSNPYSVPRTRISRSSMSWVIQWIQNQPKRAPLSIHQISRALTRRVTPELTVWASESAAAEQAEDYKI